MPSGNFSSGRCAGRWFAGLFVAAGTARCQTVARLCAMRCACPHRAAACSCPPVSCASPAVFVPPFGRHHDVRVEARECASLRSDICSPQQARESVPERRRRLPRLKRRVCRSGERHAAIEAVSSGMRRRQPRARLAPGAAFAERRCVMRVPVGLRAPSEARMQRGSASRVRVDIQQIGGSAGERSGRPYSQRRRMLETAASTEAFVMKSMIRREGARWGEVVVSSGVRTARQEKVRASLIASRQAYTYAARACHKPSMVCCRSCEARYKPSVHAYRQQTYSPIPRTGIVRMPSP